jgi:hypothetical protein
MGHQYKFHCSGEAFGNHGWESPMSLMFPFRPSYMWGTSQLAVLTEGQKLIAGNGFPKKKNIHPYYLL